MRQAVAIVAEHRGGDPSAPTTVGGLGSKLNPGRCGRGPLEADQRKLDRGKHRLRLADERPEPAVRDRAVRSADAPERPCRRKQRSGSRSSGAPEQRPAGDRSHAVLPHRREVSARLKALADGGAPTPPEDAYLSAAVAPS